MSESENKKPLQEDSSQPGPQSPGRRRLFKALGITAAVIPKSWGRPSVETVEVPEYAPNSVAASVTPTPSASLPPPSVSVSPTPTPTQTQTPTPTATSTP